MKKVLFGSMLFIILLTLTACGGGGGDVFTPAQTVAPTIASFAPTSGTVNTPVTITGSNFTGASAVRFNTTPATYTVGNATSINTTVPSGATTGPITVITPGGTATSTTIFTVISSINKLKLEYTFGTYTANYSNIYVIWAENPAKGFYYPIYICNRLLGIGGGLTGTALPYWKVKKYPNMNKTEVDAVTGATQKMKDFSVPFTIPESAPRQFTVYFETDASYNANNWFADQPAILYKADINLDNLQSEYTLEFVGWTPNENNVSSEATNNYISSIDLVSGGLQSEKRYITNLKTSSSPDVFGGADDNPQTNLVGSIRVIPDN